MFISRQLPSYRARLWLHDPKQNAKTRVFYGLSQSSPKMCYRQKLPMRDLHRATVSRFEGVRYVQTEFLHKPRKILHQQSDRCGCHKLV